MGQRVRRGRERVGRRCCKRPAFGLLSSAAESSGLALTMDSRVSGVSRVDSALGPGVGAWLCHQVHGRVLAARRRWECRRGYLCVRACSLPLPSHAGRAASAAGDEPAEGAAASGEWGRGRGRGMGDGDEDHGTRWPKVAQPEGTRTTAHQWQYCVQTVGSTPPSRLAMARASAKTMAWSRVRTMPSGSQQTLQVRHQQRRVRGG